MVSKKFSKTRGTYVVTTADCTIPTPEFVAHIYDGFATSLQNVVTVGALRANVGGK